MTYRIVDATGLVLAEIRFHSAIHDDLVAVYLQDICEVLGGAGYHSIAIAETEEEEKEVEEEPKMAFQLSRFGATLTRRNK